MEDRLVMAADTDVAIQADYLLEAEVEAAISQQAMSLAAANAMTGQSAVVNTYGFTGGKQTVAIIDSGVAWNHPALGNGFGAGYTVVGGWDFAENDANPYDDGPMGSHGTHVAGIIGAESGSNLGVATGADIVSLRVFDDNGNGYFSWVEQALQWVHDNRNSFANPITTVNLSLGAEWNANTVPNWATLENEFAQLEADGIFISVAAGNSFQDYNAPGLSYPAVSSYVVPVGAVDANGSLAYFSQRNDRIIAAPGVAITSTVPDYVGNVNGTMDDWASYSGTSMAAPYLAGASMMIREAMQFAGQANITQDDIYGVMYNTADWVYDSVTARSYARLDLQAAIDSIMGSDDYGSTAAAASNLGTLTNTQTVTGKIGTLSDADYFRFNATGNGTVTITGNFTGMQPSWILNGGGGTIGNGGNTFTFNVQQGQTYTFGIAGSNTLGKYSLSIKPQTNGFAVTDLGAITQKSLAGLNLPSGDTWYSMTATRAGTLTVEALFSHAAGNVNLQLYDADMNLIASSASGTNNERIDFEALAGQVFYLKSSGANNNVTLRMTNLVSNTASNVDVQGTDGADSITLRAGSTFELNINGVAYSFASSGSNRFDINAGGGDDTVTVYGSTANESGALRVGELDFFGAGSLNYSAFIRAAENITIQGGGGVDTINMYDSAGSDYFYGYNTHAIMSGIGFVNSAYSFRQVSAYSSSSIDRAILYGTAGNDTLASTASSSALYGAGYCNSVNGFRRVYAYGGGGSDQATLYGTAGNDVLIATPTESQLSAGKVYFCVDDFSQVVVNGNGGSDVVTFYDSAGNDSFTAAQGDAYLTGAGFNNRATGFQIVKAYASTGTDASYLYDSTTNDQLVFTPGSARISSARIDNSAFGFDTIYVYSRRGVDTAVLNGSSGNDVYTGTSTSGQLSGYGYTVFAGNFSRIEVNSLGGYDTATLTGTVANETYNSTTISSQFIGATFNHSLAGFGRTDVNSGGGKDFAKFFDNRRRSDTFYGSYAYSSMNGTGYNNTAYGFKQVEVTATGGNDRSNLHDSPGNDALKLESTLAALTSGDFYIAARGFQEVYAYSTQGGSDSITNQGTDFFFSKFGSW